MVARAETSEEVQTRWCGSRSPIAVLWCCTTRMDGPPREIADVMDLSPGDQTAIAQGRMMLVSAMARGHERRVATSRCRWCWDARRHVSAYLDGELPTTTSAAVNVTWRSARPAHRCTHPW